MSVKGRNISVAMTCCNGEKYIATQLDSILDQELRPVEIIVCDDASTDSTLDILKKYEQEGQIKLHTNSRRLGILSNFKKAVSLCDANNYVALADQDDYWLREKLRETAGLLGDIQEDGKPCMVFSDLRLVDEQMNAIASSFWEVLNIDAGKEHFGSLLFGNFISGCTIIMNPDMSKLFGEMPEEGVSMHDAWLGLIAYSFGKYKYADKPLVNYRQHGSNATFETNRASTTITRIQNSIAQLFNNKDYLRQEIAMAAAFYKSYKGRLTAAQQKILTNFVALERSTFLTKKLTSVSARAYRRTNSR